MQQHNYSGKRAGSLIKHQDSSVYVLVGNDFYAFLSSPRFAGYISCKLQIQKFVLFFVCIELSIVKKFPCLCSSRFRKVKQQQRGGKMPQEYHMQDVVDIYNQSHIQDMRAIRDRETPVNKYRDKGRLLW